MKTIYISKNFIKTIKDLSNIEDHEIENNIINILKYEQLINDYEQECKFELINERFQGLIIDNYLVYFASKLNNNEKPKSRNTYVAQNFVPCFFISLEKKLDIYITVNPLDINANVEKMPNSINLDLKIFSSLNIKISKKFGNISKFENIDEFLNLKRKIRNKNLKNKSTFIKINDSNVYIYGKIDGANLKRTFLEILIIKKLIKKKENSNVFLIPLNGNKMDAKISSYLNHERIKILYNENDLFFDFDNNEFLINNKEIKRNQLLFYKNIISKYNKHIDVDQCFACDYNVSENLICSHIHRVTDINKEFNENQITKDIAKNLIVSGENGFLLCPNHDKEFEKGMIIFDINEMNFKINNNYSYNYIVNNLIKKNYPEELRTEQFFENVLKHKKRIFKKNANF